MCYQTKDVLLAMENDSGLKIKKLKLDGGASVSDFMCQFQAELLGAAVSRPKIIETTSLGAAYLAGLAVGIYDAGSLKKISSKTCTMFAPILKGSGHQKLYDGWLEAVRRTLSF